MARKWITNKLPLAAVCVMLVIAGCGGGASQGGGSGASGSPGGGSAGSSSSGSGQSQTQTSGGERVKLKIYVPSNVEEFGPNENVNKNRIYDYLNEVTGYDIEWEIAPREGADQKINIMMASGDTPDLIVTPTKSIFTNLAQQGLLAPLNDAVREADRIMAEVTQEAWDAVTFNGNIYAVPVPQNQVSTSGLMIRKDWLKELGLAEPKTLDEYYNVMKAFKDKGAIPLTGGAADGNGNALGYLEAFAGAFGMASPYIVEGGEVIHTYIQPKAKEFLAFMNKLYAEGLLDREYPVNKLANIQEKMVGGQAGMTTIGWANAKGMVESFLEKEPNGDMGYIHPPVGPDGDWGFVKHQPVRTYLMVPRFSTKVREVIDFINKYMDPEVLTTVSYGWEGEHYVRENGQIVQLEKMEEIRYRIYYRLWDTVEDFNNRVRFSGFTPYYDPIKEHARVENILDFAPPLAAVDQNAQTLNDLRNEYFVKIITGALPLDAFDEYVSKWWASGGTETMEAIREWYAGFKK